MGDSTALLELRQSMVDMLTQPKNAGRAMFGPAPTQPTPEPKPRTCEGCGAPVPVHGGACLYCRGGG